MIPFLHWFQHFRIRVVYESLHILIEAHLDLRSGDLLDQPLNSRHLILVHGDGLYDLVITAYIGLLLT